MKIAFCSLALGVLWYVATPALADMGKDAAPLKAAPGSKAESHIAAGIEHYGLGHWDVAKKHFTEAEMADVEKLIEKMEEDDDVMNVYHTMEE